MAEHNERGKWGENQAASFLEEKGFMIIERNFRGWHAEIDLIARKEKMLVFVEVKTRSGVMYGMPEEFVNAVKAKRIMRAAEQYIFDTDWRFDVRFDIVSILVFTNGQMQIRHIEDAFSK